MEELFLAPAVQLVLIKQERWKFAGAAPEAVKPDPTHDGVCDSRPYWTGSAFAFCEEQTGLEVG